MKLYWMSQREKVKELLPEDDMFRYMYKKGFEMWTQYLDMCIQWNQLFFNAYNGNLDRFLKESKSKSKSKSK